jgi:hypothetical protein
MYINIPSCNTALTAELFFPELIEEEEAFHNFHEHRSATLGRRPMSLTAAPKTAESVLVAGLDLTDDEEYFERIRGIKNNFSRLVRTRIKFLIFIFEKVK